ncbi:response regulator [Alkalilimnicola sp. S0819]|uniref:response regulator n=1 Tax=Alkalilimnicola sp. S0819 TaxID=2613922 RepID=UPI001262429C|nr:response regulator [Alkalilimnicola sp. S0819]KAB7619728.1 response regulator [Alkalilimnicola sp. S0819]MPQ17491.1 response regulator [Alkalilimnicola sp. S0819]
MAQKRVLIVDDSRSARLILQRKLDKLGVGADCAASGEEALAWLERHRPDALFLDHMMPGLDGFEVLRRLKAQPDTADIPVYMYTSRDDEDYLRAARALGAEGVLDKQLRAAALQQALETLNLLGASDGPETIPEPAPGENLEQLANLSHQLVDEIARNAVEESLARVVDERLTQLRSHLRRDLQTGHEALVERLLAQLRPGSEGTGVHEYNAPPRRIWPWAAALALVGLLIGLLIGSQGLREGSPAQAPTDTTAQAPLDRARASLQQAAERQNRQQASEQSSAAQRRLLLGTLDWALRQDTGYDYDAVALNGERARFLDELLARLEAAGYQGRVQLRVHSGRFCLQRDDDERLRLAPPEAPLEACNQLGYSDARQRAARQTVGFANFLASNAPLNKGALSLQIVPVGDAEPLLGYPDNGNAGLWNQVARQNQRLEIVLADAP